MDPHSMFALAATRTDELMAEAQESRRARLAREARDDARSAPQPKPRPSTARRWVVAR